jgi:RimJ/RimL family protein N-acetyltransferase
METNDHLPNTTIETLSRNFYKQASNYGFRQEDYLKFVNILLEYAMKPKGEITGTGGGFVKENFVNEFEKTIPVSLPIQGKKICIREFNEKNDKPLFKKWLSDNFGRFFLLSRTTDRTLDIDQLFENENTIIGVITLPNDKPIGSVAFINYDNVHPKAELRKVIGEPDMRGKGLGKEATQLWIKYGISGLDLKKIYLHTLNTNIRNIKLNEEMGFQVEGILRNETLIDGEYHDVLRMGLWQE